MTTEIAVANRWGIAIAADSAVTIEQIYKEKLTEKVYNSANKLFTLSKFHPVGVMIYNGMTLGGKPWETIIKTIRKELKDTEFQVLEEYCNFLFQNLANHQTLFPEDFARTIVENNIYRILYEVLRDEMKKDEPDFSRFTDMMEVTCRDHEEVEVIEGFGEDFISQFFVEYKSEFEGAVKYFALNNEITEDFKEAARKLVGTWFTRKIRIPGYSGVVVCGFGSGDVFPKLFEYYADTIVCGRVRYWLNKTEIINSENPSFVLSFADSEVIETLMNGINPLFYMEFGKAIFKMISALPEILVSEISELSESQKAKYASLLKQSIEKPYFELEKELREFRISEYVHPIETTLQVLPISELATVAETFINAAQIHKRVNPLLDTVGGPVDVAVISKGDGFVWVKRKHYFDPRFNPSFTQKYLES